MWDVKYCSAEVDIICMNGRYAANNLSLWMADVPLVQFALSRINSE